MEAIESKRTFKECTKIEGNCYKCLDNVIKAKGSDECY